MRRAERRTRSGQQKKGSVLKHFWRGFFSFWRHPIVLAFHIGYWWGFVFSFLWVGPGFRFFSVS